MSTAIDPRVFGTPSHIFSETVDEAFADTFDQTVIRPVTDESFDAWCDCFGVTLVPVHTENDIALGLLTFCPFFKSKDYRDDALYEVGCMMHGGEAAYLEFLTIPR